MVRYAFVWTGLLVSAAIGCKPGGESVQPTETTQAEESVPLPEGVQLVTLKLPGMT